MSDGFYRAFEERHRGSRELIKGRLAAYLPFVESLLEVFPVAATIDLGCGRGEWLELLAESGFKPVGVDLDKGMLEACLERGLQVEQGDALAYLSALPDESQVVVSAFHVVEHITFDHLRTLVAEALRVLKPGGLLIMETPNPENIVVATRNFYIDPTHQRPIPPMLLAFAAEYAGFARVKTLRLQESKELVNKDDVSLHDVFAGASPDYAVVAQKHATDDVLALTSDVFSIDYGLSLDNLLSRWDGRFERLETKAEQAEARATQAEAASTQALMQLQAVYASTSWRITAPLRTIAAQAKKLTPNQLKPQIKLFLKHAALYVNRRPGLRRATLALLNRVPSLKQRLTSLMTGTTFQPTARRNVPTELAHLTPRARQIYADLKTAIENNNRSN